MRLRHLALRNLAYCWRTNLAVLAGVAIAVAVLSGALMVGDSVEASLRDLFYERIGAAEYVISADHFFREELAGELTRTGTAGEAFRACPIIFLQGVLIHEEAGSRALDVNVYGVDERFWEFHEAAGLEPPQDRTALVGAALARKLGARRGDSLLLRIELQQGIPRESLYGRRENIGRTVRLVCGDILPAEQLGEFALRSSQGAVHSVFVPLRRLQRDLAQRLRANSILLSGRSQGAALEQIRNSLRERFTLADLGVRLRPLASPGGISVESARIILDQPIADAAFGAAAEAGMRASGVFTYLANSIRARGREIPYSVITGVDLHKGAMTSVRRIEGSFAPNVSAGEDDAIWLNEWAWRDLGATPGDTVEVDYYLWQEEGLLSTRTARFRLAGAVAIGGEVGAELAPEYPGITDARSVNAWDPPFPLELRRIRPKDEEYWKRHRATPKAFITLAMGQELWQSRFGRLSSVRIAAPEGPDLESVRERLSGGIRRRLDPEQAGFSVTAVRERGLTASRGSTDFGEYFLYFSSFLIAAAILLSALFFRLGVEQRAREIGTLLAVGFPHSVLRRVFLAEGALLSIGGALFGLIGSVGYGWLMIFGLRTWWVGAVGTDRLHLHVSWEGLGAGAVAGVLVSLGTIAWTLRGLQRNSPRALLAGVLETLPLKSRRARRLGAVALAALAAAALLLFGSASAAVPDVAAFFGAGLLLLISLLSATALRLRRARPHPIGGAGWLALFRFGTRYATHRPGRSVLCVALIASATFIIVSVEAFRRDERSTSLDFRSGTGGYPFMGRSAIPIVHDPNSDAGREALGIPSSESPLLAGAKFVPFRVRSGDDASCLNLYAPLEPRILGAPRSFVGDARFSFQDSLASTPEQRQNPWLLLEADARDGTIPAIADANTVQYILHLALGSELVIRRGRGAPVRLRLVAALRDSLFQGELVISEANFLRMFPEQEGFRFFLIEAPPGESASPAQFLEERLADWGFSLESTRERLAAFRRVENTYLSTFQTLGALGLILGTVGLATVLLRNVLERRRELALLRAVGYRRQVLSGIIMAENLVLLAWGLVSGSICALLAILPALLARGAPFPAGTVALTLAAVLIAGLASSFAAVHAAIRSPLLDTLRSDQ